MENGKLIVELTQRLSLSDTCNFAIDDTIQTYKITALQFIAYLNSKGIPSVYDETKTYSEDDICIYAGKIYVSLVDSNTENQPDTSPESWQIVSGSGGEGFPAGFYGEVGTEDPPAEWLVRDGSQISKATYADLFAAVGNRFWQGNFLTRTEVPQMTNYTAPSGTVSHSSEFSTTYRSWQAFNRANAAATDTWVSTNVAAPHWIQYAFAAGKTITNYAIENRYDASNTSPVSWKFQGSNDGVNYTDLHEVSGNTRVGAKDRHNYGIENPASYTHYRLYITASNHATYVGIGHLLLVDATADADFYLPDHRGLSPRNIGSNGVITKANASAYIGPALNGYQHDQMQGHWHDISSNAGGGTSYAGNVGAGANSSTRDTDLYTYAITARTDTVNGTPRIGNETRPASYGVLPIIKY